MAEATRLAKAAAMPEIVVREASPPGRVRSETLHGDVLAVASERGVSRAEGAAHEAGDANEEDDDGYQTDAVAIKTWNDTGTFHRSLSYSRERASK
jgi:hypothetical protein